MSLMHMSLYGGILIIAIVIFRSVFIGKLPKNTFLVLWGLALARLLIPIPIPSSLSIYNGNEEAVKPTWDELVILTKYDHHSQIRGYQQLDGADFSGL